MSCPTSLVVVGGGDDQVSRCMRPGYELLLIG